MKKSYRKHKCVHGNCGVTRSTETKAATSDKYVVVSFCSILLGLLLYPSVESLVGLLSVRNTDNSATTVKPDSVDVQAKPADTSKLNGLPEEIRNFVPTFQRYFSPKEIVINGRIVKPSQLVPKKQVNTSVR